MTSIVKCVIWDLDDTLWEGTLAEGDAVRVNPEALTLMYRLERAGIAQSVSSKNDADQAHTALARLEIPAFFVHPQISWSAKSASVEQIVRLLNIGADSVVFLDDSPFERAEVTAHLPEVRAYSLPQFLALADADELIPDEVTEDAARRPAAYREEAARQQAQDAFTGTALDFLASLDLVLSVRTASLDDLARAAELTERTNQLNTTGRTFCPAELAEYVSDPDRLILIADLTDRFGGYGRIGLCLVRKLPDCWLVDLMLMSCRVGGRNVGNAFIGILAGLATAADQPLRARFVRSARNRQMRITYAMAGFVETATDGDGILLEHPAQDRIQVPPYFKVFLSDDLLPAAAGDLAQTSNDKGGS